MLTKEQIQAEWDKLVPAVGQKTIDLLSPINDVLIGVQRAMYLVAENQRLQQELAKKARETGCENQKVSVVPQENPHLPQSK